MLISVPTLTPVQSTVLSLEGENVTFTCRPSDSQVALVWEYIPQDQFNNEPRELSSSEPDYIYDSELRHSVTLIRTQQGNGEGMYRCYISGNINNPPFGEIVVNILQSK